MCVYISPAADSDILDSKGRILDCDSEFIEFDFNVIHRQRHFIDRNSVFVDRVGAIFDAHLGEVFPSEVNILNRKVEAADRDIARLLGIVVAFSWTGSASIGECGRCTDTQYQRADQKEDNPSLEERSSFHSVSVVTLR